MTKICISCSNAKYSAAVNAHLGVKIRSMIGSFDKFKNITTLCITPASSNERLKYSATSLVTPIAAKTTPNPFPSSSATFACLTICTAN